MKKNYFADIPIPPRGLFPRGQEVSGGVPGGAEESSR